MLCRYVKDHDAKDAVDKELAKRAAADRFWQTRDFDPIVGTFHDRTKVNRDLLASVGVNSSDDCTNRKLHSWRSVMRGQRYILHWLVPRYPLLYDTPGVPTLCTSITFTDNFIILCHTPQAKSSEGEAYNVISNLPKDEDKLRVVDHKQTRTVLHRVHTQVEAHVVNTTMAREEKGACLECNAISVDSCCSVNTLAEDGRKIGRIAHRRYADDVGHGHDIISNKPFQGIDAKTTFSPRTRKPTVSRLSSPRCVSLVNMCCLQDTWVKVEHADSRMRSTSASATGNSSRPLFATKRMTAGGDSPAPSVAVGSGAGSVRTGGFSFN